MRRAVAGFWRPPMAEGVPALVITAAFFVLGGAAGCFMAFQSSGAGADTLAAYLDNFLSAAQAGQLSDPAAPELLWRTIRWFLAAFLLGFTALGLLGVPILALLRGFFLSFSIASFSQAYGWNGLMLSFLLLGVPSMVTIPAFFLMTVQSFSASLNLAFHREYFFRCGLCVGAVCASLFLERYAVPALIAGISGALVH